MLDMVGGSVGSGGAGGIMTWRLIVVLFSGHMQCTSIHRLHLFVRRLPAYLYSLFMHKSVCSLFAVSFLQPIHSSLALHHSVGPQGHDTAVSTLRVLE